MTTAWTQKANKGGGGDFEKAPAGTHPAVLVGVIDMGQQWQDGYQGGPGHWQHRAFFVWELVQEKMAGMKDRNHVIGIDLTVSLNEKAKLRKWVEARTGKVIPDGSDYDILGELGQPCLLGVIMKGDYPKVDSVAGVPKGMTVPGPQNKPVAVSLAEFQAGAIVPSFVPYLYGEPLADVIRRSREIGGDQGHVEQRQKVGGATFGGGATGQAAPGPVTTSQPADAPPPPGGAAPSAPPPPPPSSPAQRRFWVHTGDPKPTLMTEGEMEAWAASRKADPDDLQVMPEDRSKPWAPAKEYGIKWQIPF